MIGQHAGCSLWVLMRMMVLSLSVEGSLICLFEGTGLQYSWIISEWDHVCGQFQVCKSDLDPLSLADWMCFLAALQCTMVTFFLEAKLYGDLEFSSNWELPYILHGVSSAPSKCYCSELHALPLSTENKWTILPLIVVFREMQGTSAPTCRAAPMPSHICSTQIEGVCSLELL